MDMRHKILILDDEQDLLDMYQEILTQLPSKPEIQTATTGSRAIAMLASEPFRLFICDLKMPKMDGLQVLSIVRRKYPELRTVALTSMQDEQYRSRAYALGVDLFWRKPSTAQETEMFIECLESLLGRETENGFRGVQSKSLVDIIQLECISQSSSVLRITNGPQTGKIWIQDGEVMDAEAAELTGEVAFQRILSWKAGNFETLPPDPSRARTIEKSYNGLLLESAQAMDESRNTIPVKGQSQADSSPLTRLSQVEGMEFVLAMKPGPGNHHEARGLENPELMAAWSRANLQRFRGLGERLQAGPLDEVLGLGPHRHVILANKAETEFCIGWKHSMTAGEIRVSTKKVFAIWGS
jgi:CheY-like chemotaxis protein